MSEMGDKRIALLLLKKSRHHQRSWRLRQATLVVGFFLVVYCLLYALRTPLPSPHRLRSALTHELLNNLSLDEDQCKAAFPGLTKEVDDVVALGPFVVKQAGDLGPLQGRIKNGQIEIIHAQRPSDISQEMRNSRTASLHQIYRAILTSPSPIPDTIFSLNFQDQPFGTAFTYSRSATSSHLTSTTKTSSSRRDFLIPHFSFWAWPLPFIGSMSRAASAISALESSYPDSRSWRTAKIPKAVWRGTAWYSSVTSPGLRQNLLRATKNQPWADVEQLKWNAKTAANASNALQIEDFCRYKYIIHTEGVSYSGRFQFLQMCKSVVITPPIQWMQHLTHLVKPLFSSTLDLEGEGTKKWELTGAMKRTWPVQYEPEEANMVFVNRDWSDLGATVKWLEEHPDIAEGIAQRQRELFVGGGYFSPAAETCYWRALIRGWASVAQTKGQGWEDAEGVSFEQFVLTNTK